LIALLALTPRLGRVVSSEAECGRATGTENLIKKER